MADRHASFQAIGTRWDIRVDQALTAADWQELLRQIRARIDTFDAAYSRFRDDSLVGRMSRRAGTYELPADGYALLRCYERLYRATKGKLTPLIGQTMVAAGYDATYSLQPGAPQSAPRWEEVLSYDEHQLTLRRPALLDFGAAGKGYLVDLVGGLLTAAGVTSYLVNAGGDMVHRSAKSKTLRVGLENPADPSEAIGVVALGNQSLCASAGSKRRWAGLHHIIDPQDVTSPQTVRATWVLADNTLVADGLATALFFTEPAVLRKQFDFRYTLVDAAGGLRYDPDFPVTLFAEAAA